MFARGREARASAPRRRAIVRGGSQVQCFNHEGVQLKHTKSKKHRMFAPANPVARVLAERLRRNRQQ
eukprot:16378522-Heterocapsa_arctica.AAC.1